MSDQNATMYVLGGGFMRKTPDSGCAFFQAVISKRKVANVLVCCFAVPPDRKDSVFDDERHMLSMFNEEAILSFASANLEDFLSQVAWADVIVFKGGSTQDLMMALAEVPGWESKLDGKTVVGSSAGANMLCDRYVATHTKAHLLSGLGILPVVIATHYRSTFIHGGDAVRSLSFWNTVDVFMESEATERTIVTLEEGEFLVLTEEDLKRPSE